MADETEESGADISSRQWRVIAGWAATMFGATWMCNPIVDVYPMIVGGSITVLAGIFLIEQVDSPRATEGGEA